MSRQKRTPEQRAAEQAKTEARRQRKVSRVREGLRRQFMRRRLLLVASLLELASAASEAGSIGYDGRAPEIIDAPGPDDNPQLRVARNIREHPLDLMFHKGQLSVAQFGAGEMYRRDLEMSLISPMSGRSYENIYITELSNKQAQKEAGLSDMLGPKTFAAKGAKSAFAWNDLKDLTLDAMDRANKARAAVSASATEVTGRPISASASDSFGVT